jgi:hypothetical protein
MSKLIGLIYGEVDEKGLYEFEGLMFGFDPLQYFGRCPNEFSISNVDRMVGTIIWGFFPQFYFPLC